MTDVNQSGASGFTLIELMVAVAILAIVMAIAIPSYQNYVTRTNRAEAKVLLSSVSQALERCYTRYTAYDADDCTVGFPQQSENGWYQMAEDDQTIDATTYELVAVPQGTQATRDTDCGNFTLTQNATRGVSGSADVEDCW
ncbi:MAG: prepilin-type N-terminal cleavage/methylation domain-containing protein [Gammaproteobacteria bacterium]|nr:prepilin-type N-terminal cleavage/methylation domain-containing protein [Gammaproteobacteria bacterium]